ncbi:hypothetical protein HON86_01395 [Candidatus Woesearchaeota archaeon]|jgi:uncharacterized membrane protein YbhN (UPF0104 family)|nr:hypothetical protein [Candidatus Woesearchaeota archaeon]MBT4835256.1 hypothetical protein [Candidatus Woesearchaeota archaeon]MBT7169934.1 hypothetical protein [Candidatus Woesearchaeota archaeon]MBT7474322.1 hypothetical protein [Candidatus Woesearchaeota archaeon]
MKIGKKAEIVWDKMGVWILLIILLILILLIIGDQNDRVSDILKQLKTVVRFGG